MSSKFAKHCRTTIHIFLLKFRAYLKILSCVPMFKNITVKYFDEKMSEFSDKNEDFILLFSLKITFKNYYQNKIDTPFVKSVPFYKKTINFKIYLYTIFFPLQVLLFKFVFLLFLLQSNLFFS